MQGEFLPYLIYPIYGLYLLLIVAGGLLAVLTPNLVRALLGLILTLFGVAGMYFHMAAPFMALMQILIYVGAVSVLIFFAIMLTRAPGKDAGVEGEEARPSGGLLYALAAALAPAVILGGILIKKSPQVIPLKPELALGKLGEFLVGPYALAFELISVVLFVAMAGAVLLGFERRKGR